MGSNGAAELDMFFASRFLQPSEASRRDGLGMVVRMKCRSGGEWSLDGGRGVYRALRDGNGLDW